MSAIYRHREEVLNVILAMCLSARGIEADPETITRKGKMPDVIFVYRGLRCIIEGKIGDASGAKELVFLDAKKRVESGISHLAVGVVYPDSLRTTSFKDIQNTLSSIMLDYFVYTENGPGVWHSGKVDDIISELRHAHDIVVHDDVVTRAVEKLTEGMNSFSQHLLSFPAVCDRLIDLLGIGEVSNKKGSIIQQRRRTATQIAALTIANALIFQEQLAHSERRVKPVNKIISNSDSISEFSDHWGYICDNINYIPIFRIARESLLAIPISSDADEALKELARKALEIVSERAALRHDLMGRIFHKLLIEAKYLGTYYTSVPSSIFLLRLALERKAWSTEWSDIHEVSKFKVGDFACGTGTLLMAASQSISDNYVRGNVENGESIETQALKNLHQVLMENVLNGYDVLASAVHLTASTLAMLAPEIAFRRMQLYIVPMGKYKSGIKLGSIDYLGTNTITTQLSLLGNAAQGEASKITGSGAADSLAPVPPLDLVVMNPPYVRSVIGNLLFGTFPESREEMKKELSRRLNNSQKDPIPASTTAGLGSVFTAIADKHLKYGGRVALVLPASITTGISWQKTRALFAEKYHLEYIVTSHDADKWSFSENTSLSEVLLIAKKREISNKKLNELTCFINLWLNFKSGADALAVAENLLQSTPPLIGTNTKVDRSIQSIGIGEKKYGEALSMRWEEIKDDIWIGGAFAQTELLRIVHSLKTGTVSLPQDAFHYSVPICRFSDLGNFGPDGRDVHDGFDITDSKTSFPAFWGHSVESSSYLYAAPNAFLEPLAKPKPKRPLRQATDLWCGAGKLLVTARMRFNTQALFCVYLDQPALSNVWWSFKPKSDSINDDYQKVLALWLNSTFGILLAAASRLPTEGSWIQFKKPLLQHMPILDLLHVHTADINKLARLFDSLSNKKLQTIPNMSEDPIRNAIDDAFCSVLEIPTISSLRRLLSREPIICNQSLICEDKSLPSDDSSSYQLLLPLR